MTTMKSDVVKIPQGDGSKKDKGQRLYEHSMALVGSRYSLRWYELTSDNQEFWAEKERDIAVDLMADAYQLGYGTGVSDCS